MIPKRIPFEQLILSCPWCNCHPQHLYLNGSEGLAVRVWCSVCEAAGPSKRSNQEAIRMWNNQNVASIEDVVERSATGDK